VRNRFFGEEVTVAGLLTWEDVRAQLTLNKDEFVILPSNIFNHEMKTLDDVHINDIKKELNCEILIIDELFAFYTLFKNIE
jgi:NifB/MoaA-like Fe-S oxidoreductase